MTQAEPAEGGRGRLAGGSHIYKEKHFIKKEAGPAGLPWPVALRWGRPAGRGVGGVWVVVVHGEWPSDVHVVIVLICLTLQRGLLARRLQDLQGRLAQALLPHIGSRLGRQDG